MDVRDNRVTTKYKYPYCLAIFLDVVYKRDFYQLL